MMRAPPAQVLDLGYRYVISSDCDLMPGAIEPAWTMQLKDRNVSFSVNGDHMSSRIQFSSGQGLCCQLNSEALTGQALKFVSRGPGRLQAVNCHGRSEREWSLDSGPVAERRLAALLGAVVFVSMILKSKFCARHVKEA